MFILGHVGLTAGLLIIIVLALQKAKVIRDPAWLYKIDFRVVVVLAMLPDLLDKTLGHFLLPDYLSNGRIFAHTLLFLLVTALLFAIGLRALAWVYVFPVLAHQLFDLMWEDPRTWFWPAFGLDFEWMGVDPWGLWFHELLDPFVIATEALGLLSILLIFVYFRLYRKNNFLRGLNRGRLSPRTKGPDIRVH